MTYLKNTNLIAEFNSTALEIYIRAAQINPKYNSYFDFSAMCDIADQLQHKKHLIDQNVQHKLYETTILLLRHYPRNAAIGKEQYDLLCAVNPTLEKLKKRFPVKLDF